ncbi:peptidoglycan DD-metalloendopeptidase family protein [Formosa sp. PL04]|uniref:peptidoglycan DD-metalloendopeptidase family protein n=1 Tax=Formosa sp. PL04 TaxID=3081755 RepID=UPI00298296A5|nr:peptidoglycan DD-metalloendopeptidase family protein [Formosa sp. PL04]MDW5290385.1 peptidoglycan DD-metalloendopeptidase family protein [Formosa sp. PL04]
MSDSSFYKILNSINVNPLQVLDLEFEHGEYVHLDLSETNLKLTAVNVSASDSLGLYINTYLKQYHGKVGYGGYLEVRDLYKRSTYFNSEDKVTERNIHLGIDLWCDAGTSVLAVLKGTVHSFRNNTNYGDYGPTIILKHAVSNVEFYTLYGHLSLESISKLKVGQMVAQGQKIGDLGTSKINGDYPPHLHFQIIKDIQTYSGDYPGVCSPLDLEFYRVNCPDPNVLLKI